MKLKGFYRPFLVVFFDKTYYYEILIHQPCCSRLGSFINFRFVDQSGTEKEMKL